MIGFAALRGLNFFLFVTSWGMGNCDPDSRARVGAIFRELSEGGQGGEGANSADGQSPRG
jgi:hypothetical protein